MLARLDTAQAFVVGTPSPLRERLTISSFAEAAQSARSLWSEGSVSAVPMVGHGRRPKWFVELSIARWRLDITVYHSRVTRRRRTVGGRLLPISQPGKPFQQQVAFCGRQWRVIRTPNGWEARRLRLPCATSGVEFALAC